jgi:hypothetical protein
MQRIYIFIIIAALVFVVSYSRPVKEFFTFTDQAEEISSPERKSLAGDDAYEKLGIELYRVATRLSDLQGKALLLKMAKEKREWFGDEEYAQLDELIKTVEEDVKKMEIEYQKTKEIYAKITVQKMLEGFSR